MHTANDGAAFSHLMQEILTHVQTTWKLSNSFSVLSALGLKLSPEARQELAAAGGKMKSFVLLHMTDQLRYLYFKELTDCVAPLPESEGISDAVLYSRYMAARSNRPEHPQPAVRFKPAVWRAFTTPLHPGEDDRKIRREGDDFRLVSPGLGTGEVDGAYTVAKSDLAFHADGSRFTIGEAIARISDWAARNSLSVAELRTASFVPPPSAEQTTKGNREAILAQALADLTKEELSRISIPADIVVRLLRR